MWRQRPRVAISRAAIVASAFAVLFVFAGSAGSRGIGRSVRVRVTAIAAGAQFACSALSNGQVKCWGYNTGGQLGVGRTPVESQTPLLVKGISTARSISSAGNDSCALLAAGTVACWGQNDLGQVGNGASNPSGPALSVVSPAVVKGLAGATRISVGFKHACALLSNGTVKCWGSDGFGQLGIPRPATDVSAVPVTVPGLNGVVSVGAGGPFTCALLGSGGVECWGSNQVGELGDGVADISGVAGQSSTTPVAVKGITTATGLAVGNQMACALLRGGSVQCWGWDLEGELGNGVKTGSATLAPVRVTGLSAAKSIAASASVPSTAVCAVVVGGRVECWGSGSDGELGNGKLNVDSPVPVAAGGVSGAVAVSVGVSFSCALRTAGTVACWGSDNFGTLGTGAKGKLGAYSLVPVMIKGLP